MKRTIFIIIIILLSSGVFSQPTPAGGQGHGTTGNQIGGGAPIDGGLNILLLLGGIYFIKRKYSNTININTL